MKINKIFKICLLYLLIAIIFTFPLIIYFNSQIYAHPGDPQSILWSLWWEKFSYVHHVSNKILYLLNYPTGFDISNSIINPLFSYLGKAITILTSEIVSYNFFVLLSFPLSGLAIYLVVYEMTTNDFASFLAGFIFAFSPYHLAHAQQHLGLINVYLIAFFVYLIILYDKKPTILKSLLLVSLFIATLTDNYFYGILAAVIVISYLLVKIIQIVISKDYKFLFSYYKIHILTLLLVGIFSFFFFKTDSKSIQTIPNHPYEETLVYSAREFQYVYPAPNNPFLGKFVASKWNNYLKEVKTNITEQSLYLGYIPIILSIIGLIYYTKNKQKYIISFVILCGIAGIYLSFSQNISFFGLEIKSISKFIYHYLPNLRVYSRFGLLAYLTLAILSGLGFELIIKSIKKNYLKTLVTMLFILVISIEFWIPTSLLAVNYGNMPNVYKILESQTVGPLAEYPLLPNEEPKSYEYLVWQRYHQFPLVNGGEKDSKFRQSILDPGQDEVISKLKEIGVKYLIIHNNYYTLDNAKKYPAEYNGGNIPKVNYSRLELLSEGSGDVLYKIK